MDRVDIRVDLAALDPVTLTSDAGGAGESSGGGARAGAGGAGAVGAVGGGGRRGGVRRRCRVRWCAGRGGRVGGEAALLDRAVRSGRLTGRGYDRVLRLALTGCRFGRSGAAVERRMLRTALALRCGETP